MPLVLPSLLKGNRGRVAIGTIQRADGAYVVVSPEYCAIPPAAPVTVARHQGRDTAMKWRSANGIA